MNKSPILNSILALLVSFTGLFLTLYSLATPKLFGSETARLIFTEFAVFLAIFGLVCFAITFIARSKRF
ncbi:MAG: hypothetical protein DWH70_07885 [Planctomycetota bacterium]|jgi:hypothetical protein|nr:MAG: hypothetical protein DWH70_07885 [Planctomycetota bacterium]